MYKKKVTETQRQHLFFIQSEYDYGVDDDCHKTANYVND